MTSDLIGKKTSSDTASEEGDTYVAASSQRDSILAGQSAAWKIIERPLLTN
jgi:hypothetical protein